MTHESVREYYNRQYAFHRETRLACPNAIHDLKKAQRRVAAVLRQFDIMNGLAGGSVLDVGCGLGYYTKALSQTGADVVGIDFAEAAIEAAKTEFPECNFRQGSWPDDVPDRADFDLIWIVNCSLMNTFDVDLINDQVIAESIRRLKTNGHLVIGWNSNFTGEKVDGYVHWSLGMLKKMKAREPCVVFRPFVAEARTEWLSRCLIRVAGLSKRSIPFFVVMKKSGVASGAARQSFE